MASLQVREVPAVLYGELRRAAQREHRSLSQQALMVLKKGLGAEDDPKSRRLRLVEEIVQDPITPHGDRMSDPVALIREDRDR